MKNFVLSVLLAVLVVLTATSVRRLVAGTSTSVGTPTLVAIGTDPVPPVPPGKPSGLKPSDAIKTMAIGTDPVPPVPPGKPSGLKSEGFMLLAIGTDPVPPVPPPPPKPSN